MIENKIAKVLNCKKYTQNEVIALTNHTDPPEIILEKLKNYGMTSLEN